MYLNSICLQNFRNYEKKTFEFSGPTTLVVGPNTSGKTNLLEAIYLLATGRSFRAEVEAEMIRYGEEVGRVKGVIAHFPARNASSIADAGGSARQDGREMNFAKTEKAQLEIILTTGLVGGRNVAKKKYRINGVGKRMVDFVGQLKAVYFGPEDLQLVTDSPSLRRKYLDMVLSQVDREYRRANLSYEKGVRQRNRILEDIRESGYQGNQGKEGIKRRLYFWDQLLVKNGNYITEKREEFINFINNVDKSESTKILNSILVRKGKEGEDGKFKLEYVKSVISPAALEENFQKEVRLGMTLVGPHRDDIRFETRDTKHETRRRKKINLFSVSRVPCSMLHRDLSIYGSRGEQRLAILWLKMGELEFIGSKTETRPILLLDDIFSELDEKHREVVLGVLGNQQTIITTTDEEIVEKNERKKMQVVYLS